MGHPSCDVFSGTHNAAPPKDRCGKGLALSVPTQAESALEWATPAEDRCQVSGVRSRGRPARGSPIEEVAVEDAENGGFILRRIASGAEADGCDVIESPRQECMRGDSSFAPPGLWIIFHLHPGLAPWAAFLRRFAADNRRAGPSRIR